jgi:hypothetical protein
VGSYGARTLGRADQRGSGAEDRDLARRLVPILGALRRAWAGNCLALFLARIVERAVDDLSEKHRVERGFAVARALVSTLARELGRNELRQEAPPCKLRDHRDRLWRVVSS